jgi:hypothetical protein
LTEAASYHLYDVNFKYQNIKHGSNMPKRFENKVAVITEVQQELVYVQ